MASFHQLAAIMFTDIVGYTTLMGEDEHKAFALLRQNRQLQRPLIEHYGGTWIKELGDGVLASFTAVSDAVACACSIQKAVASHPDLKLRIGIHQGEVVFEDGDVFGDSVNIASRLQALAPIGGIWISETVYRNIANKKDLQTYFVREESLKHVKEPIRVYEVNIESFDAKKYFHSSTITNTNNLPSGKGSAPPAPSLAILNHQSKTRNISIGRKSILKNKKLMAGGALAITIALVLVLILPRWMQVQKARNEWLPKIQKMSEENILNTKAFLLAKEAEKYIPNDSNLLKLWPKIARSYSFTTTPAGASVYWKEYEDFTGNWKLLGKTPLDKVWLPIGFSRVKIDKSGFKPVYSPFSFRQRDIDLTLDSINKYPANMVKVASSKAAMLLVGLEQYADKLIPEFLMDQFEVTNKEYKHFVDAGGYKKQAYWEFPFKAEGKELSWEEAMLLFVDKTGKQGPASWEVGTYPDGKENHPVTGISWYEAMAYAKYAGKKLPTVYHWSQVANTFNTWGIIPNSNFNKTGTVPVGLMNGISNWGVYDIAGNAREWCYNLSDDKVQRYILGGGWSDPTYAFNDAVTQQALDRSLSNGFRCMEELSGDTTYKDLSKPVKLAFRDYKKEKPVSDETFAVYLRQYAYDKVLLNPKIVSIADTSICKVQKIDIDAAYNKERLTLYLYLPKNVAPPYQTIVLFSGSGSLNNRVFDFRSEMWIFDFILKSGRAVCYPIIKSTFERGDDLHSDLQEETIFYKQHVIAWIQDFSRSLDYLQTRKDIVKNNFGFYGFSWGSAVAPVVCAVEKRFKAAVLHVGGFMMTKTLPEVDVLNYVPRVKIPVLMLNGKNDTFYPLETSQKPMFDLLGTDVKDKVMKVYEGGHLVPRSELMKESMNWFDTYLGVPH